MPSQIDRINKYCEDQLGGPSKQKPKTKYTTVREHKRRVPE
jgi:hypothetical protein